MDVGGNLEHQERAHFEALDEGVHLVPLDTRYTQVGFNLISVQVSTLLNARLSITRRLLSQERMLPSSPLQHSGFTPGRNLSATWPLKWCNKLALSLKKAMLLPKLSKLLTEAKTALLHLLEARIQTLNRCCANSRPLLSHLVIDTLAG